MVIGVVKLDIHIIAKITLSHDRWVTWLDSCGQPNLSHILLKLVGIVLAKVEIKFSLYITWSHDQWITWLGGWNALILNNKGYSKSNKTQ